MSAEQWDIFWPSFIGSLLVAGVSVVTISIANAHQSRLKRIEQGRTDLEAFSHAMTHSKSIADEAQAYVSEIEKLAKANDNEKKPIVDEISFIFKSFRKSVTGATDELTRMRFVSPHKSIRRLSGDLEKEISEVVDHLRVLLNDPTSESETEKTRSHVAGIRNKTESLEKLILKKYW